MAAQAQTIDRRELFLKAYDFLPSVIESSIDMALVNNDFNGSEMDTFFRIREQILHDFKLQNKNRLIFSNDQSLFKLSDDQPIRTAVTSSNPEDPIYINLDVINSNKSHFNFVDVLQTLIHEYGHKTTPKIQSVVDSVAAKIRNFVAGYETKIRTPSGEVLTSITLPTLVGGNNLENLQKIRSSNLRTHLVTTLFLEKSNSWLDLSDFWSKFIDQHQIYVSRDQSIQTGLGLKVHDLTFIKESGETSVYNILLSRDAVASPTGRLGAASDLLQYVRQSSGDLLIELKVDHQNKSVPKFTLLRDLIIQDHLKAEFWERKKIVMIHFL